MTAPLHNVSSFGTYIFSDDHNYNNDGFPISYFCNKSKGLNVDFVKIDKPSNTVYVYSNSHVIELLNYTEVREKYVRIRKNLGLTI